MGVWPVAFPALRPWRRRRPLGASRAFPSVLHPHRRSAPSLRPPRSIWPTPFDGPDAMPGKDTESAATRLRRRAGGGFDGAPARRRQGSRRPGGGPAAAGPRRRHETAAVAFLARRLSPGRNPRPTCRAGAVFGRRGGPGRARAGAMRRAGRVIRAPARAGPAHSYPARHIPGARRARPGPRDPVRRRRLPRRTPAGALHGGGPPPSAALRLAKPPMAGPIRANGGPAGFASFSNLVKAFWAANTLTRAPPPTCAAATPPRPVPCGVQQSHCRGRARGSHSDLVRTLLHPEKRKEDSRLGARCGCKPSGAAGGCGTGRRRRRGGSGVRGGTAVGHPCRRLRLRPAGHGDGGGGGGPLAAHAGPRRRLARRRRRVYGGRGAVHLRRTWAQVK